MLNSASSSLISSGYNDPSLVRAAKKGGRKRSKRQSFKKRYFPFHRLPRELIAEIFVLCVPDIEDIFKSIRPTRAAPLLLCNVSSSWRLLALSIPRLWNELSIRITNPRLNIDHSIAMTQSRIARSGELPLSLRFYACPRAWNDKRQAITMVQAHLNTFFCHASRWEYVRIDLMTNYAISFSEVGPTPLLRKFSYLTSWHDWDPCPFTSCPLLSAFSSCSVSTNLDIPGHQLTHITLETNTSTHQALDILRACKMLVEFNVEIDNDSPDQVQPLQKPIENRSLRSFQIWAYITCSGLLQSLTLPALIDFSLNTNFDSLSSISPHSVHTQLLYLFTRSRCRLEKLKLENCGFNDARILECLEHDSCSSLTILEISNDFNRPIFTDRVIFALTDKTDVLPKLSCLSLDMCLAASPGVLGDMVLNRCLHQLKTLTLVVKDLDDTDAECLEKAEKMGLDVNIITIDSGIDWEFTEDLVYFSDDD